MPSESPNRPCTECGREVTGRALTCSPTCRSRKSRRLKRGRAGGNGGRAGGNRPEDEMYDSERHEALVAAVQEELRPFAREQITDEVIKAVGGIMRLAPHAFAVLEQDILHPDPNIRIRAAQLILKYTMPEKFLPADVGGDNKITVDFTGMPTPAFAAPDPNGRAPEAELPTDVRVCERCAVAKQEDQFDSGAPRCRECQDALTAELMPPAD